MDRQEEMRNEKPEDEGKIKKRMAYGQNFRKYKIELRRMSYGTDQCKISFRGAYQKCEF